VLTIVPIVIFIGILLTLIFILRRNIIALKQRVKAEAAMPTLDMDKTKEVHVKSGEIEVPQKGFFVGSKNSSTLQFYQKIYNYDKQYQLMYICFALSLFYSFSSFIIWWPSIAITLGIDIMGVGALAMLVSCIDPNGDCYGINANCTKMIFHTIFFSVISLLQLLWCVAEICILSVVCGFLVNYKSKLDVLIGGTKYSDACISKTELMDLLQRVFPGCSVSAQLVYGSYMVLALSMLATSFALIISKIVLSIKLCYGKLMFFFEYKLAIHK
jgi:hypothetical protein